MTKPAPPRPTPTSPTSPAANPPDRLPTTVLPVTQTAPPTSVLPATQTMPEPLAELPRTGPFEPRLVLALAGLALVLGGGAITTRR